MGIDEGSSAPAPTAVTAEPAPTSPKVFPTASSTELPPPPAPSDPVAAPTTTAPLIHPVLVMPTEHGAAEPAIPPAPILVAGPGPELELEPLVHPVKPRAALAAKAAAAQAGAPANRAGLLLLLGIGAAFIVRGNRV